MYVALLLRVMYNNNYMLKFEVELFFVQDRIMTVQFGHTGEGYV